MKANKNGQKMHKRDNKSKNTSKLLSRSDLAKKWEIHSVVRDAIKRVGIECNLNQSMMNTLYSVYIGNREIKYIGYGVANLNNIRIRLARLIEREYVVMVIKGTTVDKVGAAAKASQYEVTALGMLVCKRVDRLISEVPDVKTVTRNKKRNK